MNFSFIILAIGIIIYIIKEFKDIKEKKGSKKWDWIIFSVILFLIILGSGLNYYQNIKEDMYSKNAGILSGKLGDKSIVNPAIGFETANIIFINHSKGEKLGLLGIPLDIWIENNELKVSASIRDKSGQIIAILNENEWDLKNKDYDRNFDDKALEVINNENEVVFQIKFNDEFVQIWGVFYNKDGTGSYIEQLNESGLVMGGLNKNETKIINVKKIFRYPSELYFGKRIK